MADWRRSLAFGTTQTAWVLIYSCTTATPQLLAIHPPASPHPFNIMDGMTGHTARASQINN